MQRMSPEQDQNNCKKKMEKKRLRAMIKEIGKGEGRNERKSKLKTKAQKTEKRRVTQGSYK